MTSISLPLTINMGDKKVIIHNMENNKINGLVEIFDINNKLITSMNMKDGKVENNILFKKNNKEIFLNQMNNSQVEIKEFNKNNEMIKKTHIELFANGKINGKVLIEEMKNFSIINSFSGNFTEGILDGAFSKISENKNISGFFTKGIKNGEFIIFNKLKNEKIISNFTNNILNGTVKYQQDISKYNIKIKNDKLQSNRIKILFQYVINLLKKFILLIFKIIFLIIYIIFFPIIFIYKKIFNK